MWIFPAWAACFKIEKVKETTVSLRKEDSMARTVIDIKMQVGREEADKIVRRILISDDYREINYNREVVWKKGTGMMTAMHYIKVEYENDTAVISGWVQIGVGSVGGKEHDLKGFLGVIPKKSVEKTMDKLVAALR